MIETERLRLSPASRDEMERLVREEAEPEMKAAYREMLEGGITHPGQWEWYAAWLIRRKDGKTVGDLCFKGRGADGAVEIGYGILPEQQGCGYATEAVAAAVRWAAEQPGVLRVEAETEPGNRASQRVLEKCGFLPSGELGSEGPRFLWGGGTSRRGDTVRAGD